MHKGSIYELLWPAAAPTAATSTQFTPEYWRSLPVGTIINDKWPTETIPDDVLWCVSGHCIIECGCFCEDCCEAHCMPNIPKILRECAAVFTGNEAEFASRRNYPDILDRYYEKNAGDIGIHLTDAIVDITFNGEELADPVYKDFAYEAAGAAAMHMVAAHLGWNGGLEASEAIDYCRKLADGSREHLREQYEVSQRQMREVLTNPRTRDIALMMLAAGW